MKREIKFRAWDGKNIHKVVSIWNDQHITIPVGDSVNTLFNGEFELMQYTGLNDKNGLEIYEGDIIASGFHKYHYVVEFKNAAWWGNPIPSSQSGRGSRLTIFKYCEVIGNIHQNPELLS